MQAQSDELQDLKKLGDLLDSKFEGPFGIRFGLDPIIGLIPFVGDLATTGVSIYIIIKGASLGCTPSTLVRMAGNVALENLMDTIPFLGNFFDFYWRSNLRNIALLEAHLQNPGTTTMKSRLVLGLVLGLVLAVFIGCTYLGYLLLKTIFNMFLVMD